MVQKDGIISTINSNDEHPFNFEFNFNPKNKWVETKFSINVHKGNAKQNYETLCFLKSLQKNNKLKITLYTIHGLNRGSFIGQFSVDLEVDEKGVQFWEIHAFVEEETGIIFSFEDESIFTEQNYQLILQIYHGLKTGKIYVSMKATFIIPRLVALNILDDEINGRQMKELGLNPSVEVTIYNRKLNLGPVNILTKNYKVIGNPEELKRRALVTEDNSIKLSLEIKGNVEGKLEWFPRKKKVST